MADREALRAPIRYEMVCKQCGYVVPTADDESDTSCCPRCKIDKGRLYARALLAEDSQ